MDLPLVLYLKDPTICPANLFGNRLDKNLRYHDWAGLVELNNE